MSPTSGPPAVEGVSRGLELVSGKWTILAIFELSRGPRRLSDLRRAIPTASPKMLVQTLRELENHGLVRRTPYPVVPPRVDYEMTDLERSLLNPLDGLCDWVAEHGPLMSRPGAATRKDA
jgi:DNA-binding HxlR family transcriptional regulator